MGGAGRLKGAGRAPGPRPKSPARRGGRARRWRPSALLAIPAFAVLYGALHAAWGVAPAFAYAYPLASMLCFGAYALDKSAARRGRRRIPERTLHGAALACGWPGALLARGLLRHKSSKPAFGRTLWLTVVLNVVGFVALSVPLAAALR